MNTNQSAWYITTEHDSGNGRRSNVTSEPNTRDEVEAMLILIEDIPHEPAAGGINRRDKIMGLGHLEGIEAAARR